MRESAEPPETGRSTYHLWALQEHIEDLDQHISSLCREADRIGPYRNFIDRDIREAEELYDSLVRHLHTLGGTIKRKDRLE